MICKLLALFGEQFVTFIEFRTVKNAWSANVKFLHRSVTDIFR